MAFTAPHNTFAISFMTIKLLHLGRHIFLALSVFEVEQVFIVKLEEGKLDRWSLNKGLEDLIFE